MTEQPPFANVPEYSEWERLLKNSMNSWVSNINFGINLFKYVLMDLLPFWMTLITGLLNPSKNDYESVISLGLWTFGSIISAIVMFYNFQHKDRYDDYTYRGMCGSFLPYFKIVRYVKEFQSANTRLGILGLTQNEEFHDVQISRSKLISLKKHFDTLLIHRRVELYQVLFESIPMAFLQICLLLTSYKTFKICDLNDVSRVGLILSIIPIAGGAASEFEASKSEYESVLHLLSWYESGGRHPIKVNSQSLLSLEWFVIRLVHSANICLQFYIFAFFANASLWLGFITLLLKLLVNLALVFLFPQHMLEIHQNAPYGISNNLTYMLDRYEGLFLNVSTRYNKFTHNPLKIKCYNARIPLILLQSLHFWIPFLSCFFIASMINADYMDILLDSVIAKNTTQTLVDDYLATCPNVQGWYGHSKFVSTISTYLLVFMNLLNGRFKTFNDLFNIPWFLVLLWLFQIIIGIVLNSFHWNCFKTSQNSDEMELQQMPKAQAPEIDHVYESFLVLTAYAFYLPMFKQLFEIESLETKQRIARSLIVLTLLNPSSFYRLTTRCRVFPRTSCYFLIEEEAAAIVNTMKLTAAEYEQGLHHWRNNSTHALSVYFRDLIDKVFESKSDRLLALKFAKRFDEKMYITQSHRIKRIFELLDFQIDKYDNY